MSSQGLIWTPFFPPVFKGRPNPEPKIQALPGIARKQWKRIWISTCPSEMHWTTLVYNKCPEKLVIIADSAFYPRPLLPCSTYCVVACCTVSSRPPPLWFLLPSVPQILFCECVKVGLWAQNEMFLFHNDVFMTFIETLNDRWWVGYPKIFYNCK